MADQNTSSIFDQKEDFDPSQCTEFVLTRISTTIVHLSLSTNPSIPIYTVKTRLGCLIWPDILLHLGPTKEGPLLGIVRLRSWDYDIGIGDPNALYQEGDTENRMIWETVCKKSKIKNRIWEFRFGEGDKRRVFTWARAKKEKWNDLMKELRLWEGTREEIEGGGGKLVAVWRRTEEARRKWYMKNGKLCIRREFVEESGEMGGGKFGYMVLLSFLAVLEYIARND